MPDKAITVKMVTTEPQAPEQDTLYLVKRESGQGLILINGMRIEVPNWDTLAGKPENFATNIIGVPNVSFDPLIENAFDSDVLFPLGWGV